VNRNNLIEKGKNMNRKIRYQSALRFESLESRELFSVSGLASQISLAHPITSAEPAAYIAPAVPTAKIATNINYGEIKAGSIDKVKEKDLFVFTVTAANTKIQLALTGAKNGFVAEAKVYDPNGNFLFGVTAGNSLEWTCQKVGKYTIQVADRDLCYRGNYTLGLERISGSFSCDSKTVSAGPIVTGTIDNAIQKNQYVFNVAANTKIQLALTGAKNGFVAEAKVYDCNGKFLFGVTAGNSLEWTFQKGGNYMIQVADRGLYYKGEYTLGLERISGPFSCDCKTVSVGSTVTGTIDNAIQKNQYVFNVSANTKIRLGLAGTAKNGFVAEAKVYDSNGKFLFGVTAGNSLEWTFQQGGKYMIQVADRGLIRTGNFILGLQYA
jgi:hypothetical protein